MALRDALQVKLVEKLELMNRELSAGYRLVSESSKRYVDIFVYDSVSGGAGLVTQLRRLEHEMEDFLDSALNHLDGRSCLEEKACTRACVGCLLDFRNRMDHDVVNRPLGWSLARYFRENRIPAPQDFGISGGDEINRVDRALQSYKTFIGAKGELSVTENSLHNTFRQSMGIGVALSSRMIWQTVVCELIISNFIQKKSLMNSTWGESSGEHKPLW